MANIIVENVCFTGEKCNYIKPKPLDIQLNLIMN